MRWGGGGVVQCLWVHCDWRYALIPLVKSVIVSHFLIAIRVYMRWVFLLRLFIIKSILFKHHNNTKKKTQEANMLRLAANDAQLSKAHGNKRLIKLIQFKSPASSKSEADEWIAIGWKHKLLILRHSIKLQMDTLCLSITTILAWKTIHIFCCVDLSAQSIHS